MEEKLSCKGVSNNYNMKLIKMITHLILMIFSDIFHSKFLKNCADSLENNIINNESNSYIKAIKNYKKDKLIEPEQLISIIKQQDNKVYYKNKSYDFYGSYHEKYVITLKRNEKEDFGLDIVYYLLNNGDKEINEYVSSIMSLQNNIPGIRAISTTSGNMISLTDLNRFNTWLKKISGINIKFVDIQKEREQLRKEQIKEETKRKREFEIKRAEAIYNRALKEYKEHKYEKAKQSIENAIRLSNKQVYIDLLKELDYKILNGDNALNKAELIQNNTETKVSSTKKIKMESCSKSDLLTIDGFDEEKADRYIEERDNGKIYYDIESFVAEYGLMPHQMVEIQDRLIFPQRPKNKIGRKIDW